MAVAEATMAHLLGRCMLQRSQLSGFKSHARGQWSKSSKMGGSSSWLSVTGTPESGSAESRDWALRTARTIQPTEVIHLLSLLPKRARLRKLTWCSSATASFRVAEDPRRTSQIAR
jgi:hypothetical protein